MLLFNLKVFAQLPPDDPAWDLVFSDDFNGSSLDTSKWNQIPEWNQGINIANNNCLGDYEKAYIKWYGDNSNHSVLDTTNTKISGSTCKLYTRKEEYIGEAWEYNPFRAFDTTYQYTTGMLYSKYKFKYGYFEIKFKLPDTVSAPLTYQGFGPNFFLYGGSDTVGDTYWSEIDIFEINAYNQSRDHDNYYSTNVHYQADSGSTKISFTGQHGNVINSNQWHVAACNWTPDSIEFFLDGVKLRQYNAEGRADSLVAMPIFIDINSPSSGFCSNFDTAYTVFPYTYEIDYVKVYQKKMTCDTSKSYCDVTSSGYISKVYQDLTIGGVNCDANISSLNNSSLAKDYILLQEGFMIDNSSNIYINTAPCVDQISNRFLFSPIYIDPTQPPTSFIDKLKEEINTQ